MIQRKSYIFLIFEKIEKIGKKCGSVFIFGFLGPGDIGPKYM